MSIKNNKNEFGDFQTPFLLAKKVVEVIKNNHKINPDHIIEPTCGKGSFIVASATLFENSIVHGYEINEDYVNYANKNIAIKKIFNFKIKCADFFNINWDKELSSMYGELLIIGNPPWVTSSVQGRLNANNMPTKTNFQKRRGIDSITGSGNFDISEWMLLEHITWLDDRIGTIAFLCKLSVARKIIKQIRYYSKGEIQGHIYLINAKKYFGVSVEACLFVLIKKIEKKNNKDFYIYDSIDSLKPSRVIGERNGVVINNIDMYEKWEHLQGKDYKYIWRSGIKHDCSRVMELKKIEPRYINGFGDSVELEETFIFPLLKGSDIGNGRTKLCRKYILVTQQYIGQDTSRIKEISPKTWSYLIKYERYLSSRKSTIYRGKPRFSIFGVGDYSFSNWKIAVSALYKKLNFYIISPINNKPVIFDDTVYFISVNSEDEALFIYSLLNSNIAKEFLSSLIFWDEKRPITIKILSSLSLEKVAKELGCLNDYHKYLCID